MTPQAENMKGRGQDARAPIEAADALWRGEVTNELRHITQNIRGLERQFYELRSWIAERLEEHLGYHRANEHR